MSREFSSRRIRRRSQLLQFEMTTLGERRPIQNLYRSRARSSHSQGHRVRTYDLPLFGAFGGGTGFNCWLGQFGVLCALGRSVAIRLVRLLAGDERQGDRDRHNHQDRTRLFGRCIFCRHRRLPLAFTFRLFAFCDLRLSFTGFLVA